MATKKPDRVELYRVSFIVGRARGEASRARELRERWFAATTPDQAAAHAVRWGRETCSSSTEGWRARRRGRSRPLAVHDGAVQGVREVPRTRGLRGALRLRAPPLPALRSDPAQPSAA